MMIYRLIFLLLLVNPCFGQINWKPCQDAQALLEPRVKQFNVGRRDGLELELYCTYRGDPNRKPEPVQHVALTQKEIQILHTLRESSHAAFEAEDAYKKYLVNAHHIRQLDYGDPCWFFVGFVLNTDYITVDPNPMLSEPNLVCGPVFAGE